LRAICLDSIKIREIYMLVLQFARDMLRFYKDAMNIQGDAAVC